MNDQPPVAAVLLRTERALLDAAARWVGVPYGRPASRYDASAINCSTLTAHVLDDVLPGGLSSGAWGDIVIADGRRPWSPVERAVADGWGVDAPDGPVWTGVYLAQGWVELPPGRRTPEGGTVLPQGHAFLVWYDGLCRVLEASSRKHVDGKAFGVRWRGSPDRAPLPLDPRDAPTLAVDALAASYPHGVRWCRLRLATTGDAHAP